MEALSQTRTTAVLPERVKPLLDGRLPEWIEPIFWDTPDDLERLAPLAEIGWFDLHVKPPAQRAIALATRLKWLNTNYAGVDWMPLADMASRNVTLTCGSGLSAISVAEFAVMTMLNIAKDYRSIVEAQARHEWLKQAPGTRELAGSRALVLGNGAIGQAITGILRGFGVDVSPVSSRGGENVLSPDEWRGQLGGFDWIILALPGTPETRGIIGEKEISSMASNAVLVNFARADCVDQPALISALETRKIHAAVLDLTDPEPLLEDHKLWTLDNAHITMHLSGIPTPASQERAATRFIANCEAFRAGKRLEAQVNMARGY